MNGDDWKQLDGIPIADDEPVFNEPWQAQVFALTVTLNDRGVLDWGTWAQLLSQEIADRPDEDYWSCWFAALQAFLTREDIVSPEMVERRTDQWHEAARRTPHGQPITLEGS